MIDLQKLQKRIYANKVAKGFNTKDVNKEITLLVSELGEFAQSYMRRDDENTREELADIAIVAFGIAEIMKIDLEKEILKKVEKNEKRKFKKVKGVWVKVPEQTA